MPDEQRSSGLIVILAVVLGLALGGFLAVWVIRSVAAGPGKGQPASELDDAGEPDAEILRVVLAGVPSESLRVARPAGGESLPQILLVAFPDFGPRQRALLFLRPAAAGLCDELQGVALAAHWYGGEPVTVCAVGDPPRAGASPPAVESC